MAIARTIGQWYDDHGHGVTVATTSRDDVQVSIEGEVADFHQATTLDADQAVSLAYQVLCAARLAGGDCEEVEVAINVLRPAEEQQQNATLFDDVAEAS